MVWLIGTVKEGAHTGGAGTAAPTCCAKAQAATTTTTANDLIVIATNTHTTDACVCVHCTAQHCMLAFWARNGLARSVRGQPTRRHHRRTSLAPMPRSAAEPCHAHRQLCKGHTPWTISSLAGTGACSLPSAPESPPPTCGTSAQPACGRRVAWRAARAAGVARGGEMRGVPGAACDGPSGVSGQGGAHTTAWGTHRFLNPKPPAPAQQA